MIKTATIRVSGRLSGLRRPPPRPYCKPIDSITFRIKRALHGLLVSIKEQFNVKGIDSSIGWVGLSNKSALADSKPAGILRKLGAVLYLKANIPQSLMMSDSYNNLFGQCINTLDHNSGVRR
ncbi:hypothetical protein BJX99DRAFT_106440 [Aspergillus californicus]